MAAKVGLKDKMGDVGKIELQATGIKELDKILGGGIPKGHAVLISGNSGAGKTILAMQWLFRGFKENQEPGIYITLTEPISKSIKNMSSMTFFDFSVLQPTKIHLADLRAMVRLFKIEEEGVSKEKIDRIVTVIENLVAESKVKRMVIDSVTAIGYLLKDKDLIRYFIFKLGTKLAELDCTTILTSEVSDGGYSVFGVEEFIADGILKIDYAIVGGSVKRTLQIAKMRGISYRPEVYSFKIDKEGLDLFARSRVPLKYKAPSKRVCSGVPGLDDMCGGGLYDTSSTLIAGATGTGKTTMSLQFIWAGLQAGESCLYISVEESPEQLIRMAEGFGLDLAPYMKSGKLTFLCEYPDRTYPDSFLDRVISMVEKKKITRAAVDSLSGIGNIILKEAFNDFSRNLVTYLKYKGITSYFTAVSSDLMGSKSITEMNLSSVTDNIILLKYMETQGELGFMITMLKTRASDRDKKLRSYEITDKGMVIGGELSAYEGVMSGETRKVAKTTEEKVRGALTKTLGPMGLEAFDELKERGLSEQNLLAYVGSLVKDKILKKEQGDELNERLKLVLNGGE